MCAVDEAKLRLALCITELEPGGAERALVQLAQGLDRNRFDPIVYCLAPRPPQQDSSLVAALENAGIETSFLDARGTWSSLSVLNRLTRLFKLQRPHIVQTFLFHANAIGRIAARRAGVPRVVCGIRVAERRGRWRLWADRWTSRWVDVNVCVSQAVADFSRARGGLAEERLIVIPNGIDVAIFDEAAAADLHSLGLPRGRRAIAFVGRLDEQKGLPWLLEHAPLWLSRLDRHDLLIVGRGPQRAMLEALARQSGMGRRVHFAGWRDDIATILKASDLLVLPSAWEGMPNVVLEAMAAGRPVVATDVEGVRELLGPAAEAQVVRQGDAESFASKLVAIAGDAVLASQLGAANRRRAEERFSLSAMLAAYQDLYERLAGA
jgi:glycosyltransferase involved in cell wall biosynthesis